MHMPAYMGLLLSLMTVLFLAGYVCWASWVGREKSLVLVERGFLLSVAMVLFSSAILTGALVGKDYSFLYVYSNVDNTLPLIYRIAAFWAGREGSLMFWELCIAAGGAIFVFTPGYQNLKPRVKMYYWVFFLAAQAMFLLLLTCWSNPFMRLVPIQTDGLGLNPLLQNPAMAIHPPLLFLGYALFTIPASVALASMLAGQCKGWIAVCRNWNIMAWMLLTAGIVLGAWWSYMELGWGGYWAWDPVENASLIPWFSATAFLHTAIIENRRNSLQRTNVFLMSLTLFLCIFATYLVRSGVDVQSLHTFGSGAVALPLTLFMFVGMGVTLLVIFMSEKPESRPLDSIASRQGMILITAWVLAALGLIVAFGTMWPVISKMWSSNPIALDQGFYNRVCLPLFTVLVVLFCICPWLGWKGGVRNRAGLLITLGVMAGMGVFFYTAGIQIPLALIAIASSLAAVVSVVLIMLLIPGARRVRNTWGAYAIHLGVVLMTLGVAFSGPYKTTAQEHLTPGQSFEVAGYTVTYDKLDNEETPAMIRYFAELRVTRNGEPVGELKPERRWYFNSDSSFAEVSVIPGLIDEIYSTLAAYDAREGTVTISVSVNPLVNWLWIGSTLMCLASFLLLKRRKES